MKCSNGNPWGYLLVGFLSSLMLAGGFTSMSYNILTPNFGLNFHSGSCDNSSCDLLHSGLRVLGLIIVMLNVSFGFGFGSGCEL